MKKHRFILKRTLKDVFEIIPFASVIVVLYLLFIGTIPAILTVLYEKLFRCVLNGSSKFLIRVGLLIFAVYFIRYIFLSLYAIAMNAYVFEKVSFFGKKVISSKCANLDLINYEETEVMNLKEMAESCVNQSRISQFFMNILEISTSILGIFLTIGVLSKYNIWFLPISLLSVIPYVVARIIRGNSFFCINESNVPKLRIMTYIWKLFFDRQSAKELKLSSSQKYLISIWYKNRNEVNNEIWNFRKKDSFVLLMCDLFRIISFAFSILLAMFLLKKSIIEVSAFGACLSAFSSMQQQFKDFLIKIGESFEQSKYIEKYYEFLDLNCEDNKGIEKNTLIHSIKINHASFIYPNSSTGITDITFSIDKGEKIAIVGENGSGKTTLVKVIMGLYRCQSGSVLLDELDLNKINVKSRYKIFSSVSQDFVKYFMTYRENVAISDISNLSNDDKIIKVIRRNGNGEVLEKLSLDDLMGLEFGGKDLSGGQWQKTAISRATFKDSAVIVLDEPTSALDPIIEYDVLSLLLNTMQNTTSIIISHRIGVCQLVDKIAVLQKGRLVEFGSHSELLALHGYYYHMYISQKEWYQ